MILVEYLVAPERTHCPCNIILVAYLLSKKFLYAVQSKCLIYKKNTKNYIMGQNAPLRGGAKRPLPNSINSNGGKTPPPPWGKTPPFGKALWGQKAPFGMFCT